MLCFRPARQNECGVVILHKRVITPLGENRASALVAPEKSHAALFAVHLESPNLSPHALPGAFSGATVRLAN